PLKASMSNMKSLFGQALDNLEANGLARRSYDAANAVRKGMKRERSAPPTAAPTRRAEFDYPFDPRLADSAMPGLARTILNRAHLQQIADQRRENYQAFVEANREEPVFDIVFDRLPDRVCPWALPIRIDRRSEFDLQFRAVDVPVFTFGETLHREFRTVASEQAELVDSAVRLSESLLCVPVHPGVDARVMREWHARMRDVVGLSCGAPAGQARSV
ncbi:MAG: hypothetical protein AAFX10_02640, partial [Pseudomonadota bacterium]